ncbi:F-type H+-transporting ATPase subunit delta [Planctomycetaceae bacterium]|nr:F-type H+-transporting ATPase subunit delta [Planctomycetaceae bacterium]
MRSTRVARRYAQALMSAAEERSILEKTTADLTAIAGVIRGSRDFRTFLTSPVVSIPRKKSILQEVFGSTVSKETLAFLDLLVTKQREGELAGIIEQFHALHDLKMGIANVDVTTALELTAQQQKALQKELEQRTGKSVRLRVGVDPSIRGGLVVRIGDTVLDASLSHQLERLRERFARGAALPH